MRVIPIHIMAVSDQCLKQALFLWPSLIAALCSDILVSKPRPVSPKYAEPHCLHGILYTPALSPAPTLLGGLWWTKDLRIVFVAGWTTLQPFSWNTGVTEVVTKRLCGIDNTGGFSSCESSLVGRVVAFVNTFLFTRPWTLLITCSGKPTDLKALCR